MIQTGIKLNNIIDFIKEHLSILIIVPAFIGGLWQVLELMSISITYVRFFSISQVVSDGILILLFIVISLLFSSLSFFADDILFIKDGPKPPSYLIGKDYEIYRKKTFVKSLILFSIIYILLVYYFTRILFDKPKYSEFKSDILVLFFGVYFINKILNICYISALDKHKDFVKFCNVLLLALYIIIAGNVSRQTHNIFISPSNTINIEQVKNDVANKFPNTEPKLLYFNDKYIFFKIIDKIKMDKNGKIIKHTSKKIYIMKFETLFEN